LKKGWQTKQLGEMAELKGRIGWRGLTAKEYTESGPLFLSVHSLNYGDYVDFRDAFHISEERYVESPEIMPQKDDVLICKDGAGIGKVGIVGMLPDRTTINSSLLLIRSSDLILPKFLYRCLSSPYFRKIVNSRLNGATTPHLYQRDITEFPVVLPPLPEQQRIVSIIDEAFEGIATAKANAEKNIQNARALFESRLQSVFTQRGEGWVEKRLEDVCVLQRGFDLPTRSRVHGDFPLVSSSGISDTHNEGPVKGPGVATGRSGSIGNVFYIQEDYWPLNTVLYVKQFHGNDPKLVYWLLKHFDLKRFATGTGVPTLNRNFVHDERVLLPESKTGQKGIADQLDALQIETQRLELLYQQKIDALEALKKSLLHQAFSGHL
jgi:type I restriction enzyme S subunit